MQPKLGSGTLALLDHHGYRADLHQPVTLFVKNGRKLPNVAEPGDPWQCFLRLADPSSYGVIATAVSDTPDDAVMLALYNRPGIKPAMLRLTRAVEGLIGALHAGKD